MKEFDETRNKHLLRRISHYKKPSLEKSLWQITNTVVPYIIMWVVMIFASKISWWLVLPLAIIASGFVIRAFIIFHDCGHGAFFKSEYTNDMVGSVMGMIALTPYYSWHNDHRIHHGTSGNLEKRGTGDVWTMTTEEYFNATPRQRLIYRIYRNPIIMFLIGAPLVFLIVNRFTKKHMTRKEKYSVYATNAGILAYALLLIAAAGFTTFLYIQLLVMYFASAAGVYLFYVQHQFPDVHWYDDENWNYTTVAIQGSSYFKLPRILQWFSGNIGFHHIHHLSSAIPNYNLEKCFLLNQEFQRVSYINLRNSFATLKLKLWDEASKKLLTWAEVKRLKKVNV